MDIQCPGCGSLNAFNTDEITQSGKRIECNDCKLPFLIRPKQSPAGQVEAKDRVMVANANPPFRDAIRDFLAGNGFEVFLVKDGVEALQLLEMATPRVAIIDVALPGMYGFEICDFIRNNERFKDVKIILLASIYDKTRYKRVPTSIYGADDYIEMHHIPDELVPKINRLIGRDAGLPQLPRMALVGEFEAVVIEEAGLSKKIKEIAAEDIKIEPPGISKIDKAHEDAKRLARIIMSDIILYNHETVKKGLKEGNLLALLKDDIREGQFYYAKRVPAAVRKGTYYLKDAYEELIAKMKKELGV